MREPLGALRAESAHAAVNSTYEELRKEIQHAKAVVNDRKQAFLNAVGTKCPGF